MGYGYEDAKRRFNRRRSLSQVPECTFCGRAVHEWHDIGCCETGNRTPVFWHAECYMERFGTSAADYERIESTPIQTELSARDQERIEGMRKKTTITDKESKMKLTNTKCYTNLNTADGAQAVYTSGYAFTANGAELFVHKARTAGRTTTWNVTDPNTGMMLVGGFRTRAEALASVTPELTERFKRFAQGYKYRALVRAFATLRDRGSAMPKKQWDEMVKTYEGEEWAKLKATVEPQHEPEPEPEQKPEPKPEPEPEPVPSPAENVAAEVTLETMREWCAKRENVVAVQRKGAGANIRIEGETRPYKDELKELGFRWSRKGFWWRKPEELKTA